MQEQEILRCYKSCFWFALVVILVEIKPQALLQITYTAISICLLDCVWQLPASSVEAMVLKGAQQTSTV